MLRDVISQTGKQRRLWGEPLVHFVVIGALVFGAHAIWQRRVDTAERTISISSQEISRLSAIWNEQTGREPTSEDVKGLVAEYIREEALYREALRLGLERDDTIIRRRLAQKMSFLMNRDEERAPLSEADLRAAFEAEPETYARPDRISFRHVPFNFAQGGETREAEMADALTLLSAPEEQADWTRLGDPFLLARVHTELSETELTRLFGRAFAQEIFALEAADWSGPYRSRLAWHLVRVDGRVAGGVPAFEEIVDDVRAREMARQTQAANAEEMTKLLERYTIILNDDPN